MEINNKINNNENNAAFLFVSQIEYNNKNDKISSSPSQTENITENERELFPQVSPLDPNMSSVARYSPVSVSFNQDEDNNATPIIIQQETSTISTEDHNFILSQDNQHYFELMDNENNMQLISNNEQGVELLITDHTTGISYSVNAQELFIKNNEQPLLDSIIDPDLLTLDSYNNIDENNSTNNESNNDDNKIITRSNNKIDEEEKLLSSVYSINDKPILSRARASLPESYLSLVQINKEEDAVFAKKRIPKRTQFGPLKGDLELFIKNQSNNEHFLIQLEGVLYSVNVSDESSSNWMGFVRRAKSYEEQNLIISQENDGLYFTSTKLILPKEELKVGYSTNYAKQFNLEQLLLIKNEEKSFICYECSDTFVSCTELDLHLNQEHEQITDKILNKKKNSIAKKIDIIECNLCKELFNNSNNSAIIKDHLLKKHKLVERAKIGEQFSIYEVFQCSICSIKFKSENLLNIHKLEHNAELTLDQLNHVCPQCLKKFPTRKQLVNHVSQHKLILNNPINAIKCPICHKCFANSIRLQKHMLCHGSDQNKPLECPKCKKRFLTGAALSFHSKVHLNSTDKHFECPLCKECFDHVLKLRLHIPKHANNNGSFSCPHCNKIFTKYSFIRKHIRFHSEKKHECPECFKKFPTTDSLKKHMLKHSDHREFLCADCGKQFKRKDKLAEHIKKLHIISQEENSCKNNIDTEKLIKVPITLPSSSSSVGKEPLNFHRFIYKCNKCLVGFKRRGMLVNHLSKRHPDIPPDSVPELNLPILQTTKDYYCQYCDKVYKSNSKRKLHVLKNHPGAALPNDNGQKSNSPTDDNNSTFNTITTRPKKCEWCHRQYARKSKLLHHIRKAHPCKIEENSTTVKKTNSDIIMNDNNNIIIEGNLTEIINRVQFPLEQCCDEVKDISLAPSLFIRKLT